MMLAKQSPSSIVYPTLVDVNANEEKPPEELQHILSCLVIAISFIIYFALMSVIDLQDPSLTHNLGVFSFKKEKEKKKNLMNHSGSGF